MVIKKKLIFFILFFILNFHSLLASAFYPEDSIKPYCEGKIQGGLDNRKIEKLEIRAKNNRAWSTNLLQAILKLQTAKELSEHDDWFGEFRISNNFKKRYDAKVLVKYSKSEKCSFDAKIRITGDLWWHLDWLNGVPVSSIHVQLINGHINNITRFKLLLPNSRYGANEIFTSILLKESGFLSPRTYFINSIINGFENDYIFQEDLRKEFLENLNMREGPILEGDERFTIMRKDSENKNKSNINLSKIINKNYLMKSKQNSFVGLDAVSNLNLIYLQNHNNYLKNNSDKSEVLYLFTNELFDNKSNSQTLETYEALIYALDATHHLSFDDRRFYFNSIEQSLIPVYYDGKSQILETKQINGDENLLSATSVEAQKGAKNAIKIIKSLNDKEILEKLNFSGLTMSKKKYLDTKNKIIKRLNLIQKSQGFSPEFVKLEEYFKNLRPEESKGKKIVFTDFKNKLFYLCDFDYSNCTSIKFNNYSYEQILADIISQDFEIVGENNSDKNQFIFVHKEKTFSKETLFYSSLKPKWKSINIGDSILKFNNHISIDVKYEEKLININQKNKSGRVIITGGSLKDWIFNFNGNKNSKEEDGLIENYMNLTGCLNFYNSNLNNISVFANNTLCEDAVNVINSKGSIEKISINNTVSDAIDFDFSNLDVDNVEVFNALNDCIDFSYGTYNINKINLNKCGDKAISVGEKSKVNFNDITVKNSNIGVAAKDSSRVKIVNLDIKKTLMCLTAYRKKQEFSGAIIELKNSNCKEKDKMFVSKDSKIYF